MAEATHGAVVAGRYVLERSLKSGNGVDTFLAHDLHTDTAVVLKSIDSSVMHAAARLRLEHESLVLRKLSDNGLPGLHDAGFAADHIYLVQPYVQGTTLETLIAAGPLPLLATLRIGIDVATALGIAHDAGICHRDVKPANVLVHGPETVETATVKTATLVDFGFARSSSLDESIRDDLVGTVRYLAPEAAGLLAAPVDERSDLYALGVLLFECAAGQPPFTGAGVGELLRQHLSMPVPELRTASWPVPRALDAVVQRLLRKEPAERYQSAAAVAGDLAELLAAVEAGDPDPALVIGRFDQRHSLTDPAFVGRESELSAVLDLVRSISTGSGGLTLLEAESGGGKSRLLTEVAQQARQAGVTVLHGQGVAQVAQRPFTLLHGVAADLLALAAADPQAGEALSAAVADVAPEIVRALPSLGPLLTTGAQPDTGPEQFGEQRSLSALRALLGALATPERPVLLVLDDCQWADTLTVRLLADLAADPDMHLGVVAAFRSEEVPVGHPLRAIEPAAIVGLGPLSPAAMSILAESMAGPLPDAAVAAVARLADGSPFMGAAVLRGLVECGALIGQPGGWSFDETALKDVQTARRSAAFLVRRLELLPDDALELLSIGAVLGKEFDVALAVRLADESGGAATILEDARRRRLLWVDERTGRCTFFHDKIREALLSRLRDTTRRELHSRAADALPVPAEGGSPFELAYHLDAAGRGAEALPHALAAAEISRTQHALDAAVVHYRMAERAADERDHALLERIAEGLGDVLTLQGVYAEAETQLARARSLVDASGQAAAVAALDGKLGDLAFKQGDVTTAKRHLEGAVARLGRPVPRGAVVLVLRLFWEVAVQAAHTTLPRLTTGRRRPQAGESDFLAMRLYSRLAYLYWFHSGLLRCAWAHLCGLNLAERYPPSAELGQAHSEHAPVCTMLPAFGRGVRYAERSLEIRRRLRDVWGQGQSLGFAGVTLYAATQYERAATACQEAIRLLERTGDRWEVNTAGWNLAMCQHRRGELVEAAATAERVFRAAQAIGDAASAGISLSVWAKATGGRIDPELIRVELERGSEDAHTSCELHMADALRLMRDAHIEPAVAQLAAGIDIVRRAGLRQEYIAPVFSWYATALRRLAEATPDHNPALRSARLRDADAAVRRARRWAFSYRNNQPHALREAGLVASLRDRPRRARRLLARSIAVAEQHGACYERAVSELALAELSFAAGGPQARLDAAQLAVRSLEVPVETEPAQGAAAPMMSVFDRFTTLLKVGRTLTAATSPAAVDAAIHEAALALLRGERCCLVDVARLTDASLTTQSGESVDEVSRTLLARAVSTGAPVVASGPAVDDSESLLLSGLRSVLAAPITVHGEPVACFYVTHRHLGDLFGDEEIQLAAFIATLAGAAYEHLAGSEDRFRSLAQNSSDVLTLVDSDGIVSYQSAAVTRIFALRTADLVGKPVTDWVHPTDLPRFTDAVAAATTSTGSRVECRFRHADGSYRFAETTITDLREDPTVASLVLNTRDTTERHRLEDELRERALHDALTGLPNRALFLDRASQSLERCGRTGECSVVAFLDLDDFKTVNDTYGHGMGDALLCAMATRLSECVRPADTVARFGGDEFALLLDNTDLAAATQVVERILRVTGAPFRLGAADLVVRTSVGLVLGDAQSTPDQLLARADAAMYAAKARGKGCFEVFAPAMSAAIETRSRLRLELDRALTGSQFRLHYQPIIDLRTGSVAGVEALIRWQHPEAGLLPPLDFIDYAEQSAQIVDIGTWVLGAATRAAMDLGTSAHMSVNVSARQLQHPSFAGSVADALAESGLAPHRLVLEITETGSDTDTREVVIRLQQLKALGVQVALDDFGTGYSPLSYLRQFPVDYLKVDRSFVRNMTTCPEDAAIVGGVVQLAHSLGLRAVAEGVEQSAQRDLLQHMGCDLAQGYLWMRPAPLTDFTSGLVPSPRSAVLTAPGSPVSAGY